MRSLVYLSLIAMLAAACSGPVEDDLAKLTVQRDSLMALSADASEQLATVKEQIAELDTNSSARVLTVTALELQPERFEHFFKVQGVVEAEHNALLFPEAPARITDIKVSEGQNVSKGQVLMTLDSKVVMNQVQELRSRLTLAETVYKKQKSLWDQEIGSEIQFLEAENNYEALKQNVEMMEAQLAMYSVKAPFSGMIDEITPKVGEMANPAMPVIRLINTKDVYLKADVSEGNLGKIKEGDSVKVEFPALGKSTSTAIARIGSYINPNNRTFKIRLELKGNELDLKPNMLGELVIRDYHKDSTAVIPSSLLQMTPTGEEFVYTIGKENGGDVAQKVMVETGLIYKGTTEITSGLSGNERLIDKGARSIKEGDVISVTK